MDSPMQKQYTAQSTPAQTAAVQTSPNSPHTQSGADVSEEIASLEKKVVDARIPADLEARLLRMIQRLKRMARYGSYSGDFELVDKYADWITSIPWNTATQDNLDLSRAKQILDRNHYGMTSVKELILDYLAVMKLRLEKGQTDAVSAAGDIYDTSEKKGAVSHAPIICFVGLQGVGKTTMAKSIAETLGRKFVRVSLGAIGSVTQLRGQSRAYMDAEPGQIVKALTRTGTMNPVILLDEIDKVSGQQGVLSDVMAALLEILDPEQNYAFMDHYVDYPIDLSDVLFVATANNLGTLSAALLDRLEVIRFTSYSDEEKVFIAKDYLLPRVLEATALDPQRVIIDEDVWPQIVRPLGFDAGIRQLERNLTSLCRRVAREIVEGKAQSVRITLNNVKAYMPESVGTLS